MVLENSASWEPARENLDPLNMMPEVGVGVPNIKVLGIGGGGSNAVSRLGCTTRPGPSGCGREPSGDRESR